MSTMRRRTVDLTTSQPEALELAASAEDELPWIGLRTRFPTMFISGCLAVAVMEFWLSGIGKPRDMESDMVTITHEGTAAAAFALSVATLEVLLAKAVISREEGREILERAAQSVEGNPPHGWAAAQALRFAQEGPLFAQK